MNCMKLRAFAALLAAITLVSAQTIEPERLATMIEALTRLGPEKVNANPKLQEALGKVLAATRGTPQFVKLVEEFQMKGQNAGLLEVALKLPADEAGVAAMRLVLAANEPKLIAAALAGTNAPALAQVLGNTADKRVVPLLLPILADAKGEAALRKAVVRALAQTQEGATELLRLAREEKLGSDVKFVAGAELNAVRWLAIKAEAAKLLPPPAGQNDKPLPPVAELLKMKSDAKNGETVYFRESVGCGKCHQVNGKGTDFGPALSEIGSKLGKDALLESILDPSAGVSFGYEAWSVELKNGDELFGLVVSDAADELALKAVGGVVTRVKKSDIAKRAQSKLSVMPAGLAQTMTVQELVDLLEFLSTLKKK